jgi:hypothetical protein
MGRTRRRVYFFFEAFLRFFAPAFLAGLRAFFALFLVATNASRWWWYSKRRI